MDLEFEWDENKAASNFIKHGIRFEEVRAVFENDHMISEEKNVWMGDRTTDETVAAD
jgi:uncharacterized protein